MSALPTYEGDDLPIPIEGIRIVIVCIIFGVLAVIATGLRFWSRQMKGTKLALNDYAAAVALFFTIALVVDVMLAVYMGGEGQHIRFLGLKQLSIWSRVFFAGQLLWAAANCAVKISILHLYLTVFVGPNFKICCFVMMGFSIAYMIMTILVDFLLCTPVALNWDDFVPGHCGSQKKAYLSAAIINLLIDVCIVVLPMPLLWGLQMPVARKLGLSVMFGLGAVICVITILRINSASILDLTDATFSSGPLSMWTVLEPTLGVVNACLPAMRPALQRLFGHNLFGNFGSTLGYIRDGSSRFSKRRNKRVFKSLGRSTNTGNSVEDDSNDFHHLNEYSYPMGVHKSTVEGQSRAVDRNKKDLASGGKEADENAIKVTSAWDVHTNPASLHDSV